MNSIYTIRLIIDMETYNFNQSGIKNIPVFCCGVYAIRNNLNGHMYVGSSTNIRSRL
jgi:hypothetical protein